MDEHAGCYTWHSGYGSGEVRIGIQPSVFVEYAVTYRSQGSLSPEPILSVTVFSVPVSVNPAPPTEDNTVW
jgi:hypothetical protein